MEFPEFTEHGPLTAFEADALRALFVTRQDIHSEYQSAIALADRMDRMHTVAGIYSHGSPLTLHTDALHQLGRLTTRYEINVGLLAWRYTSTAVVLGTRLLDRVVHAKPAFTDAEVMALCEEPTLGDLRDCLSIPLDVLLVARDVATQEHHEQERQRMLGRVEGVIRMIVQGADFILEGERNVDDARVAAGRLSDFERPKLDPLFEELIKPLMPYADQFPNEIGWYMQQRAGSRPRLA